MQFLFRKWKKKKRERKEINEENILTFIINRLFYIASAPFPQNIS